MHSTCNLDDGYMGSGKRLRYSIRKYGVINHKKEIIKFFETRDLLIEAEKKAITPEMITDNNCMNLKEGGTGGFVNEEHQIKCSQAGNATSKIKFDTDEEFRNKRLSVLSEIGKNTKNLRNDTFSGKHHSNTSKQLMSESSKGMGTGNTNSQYGTCWITKEGVNKKIKKEEFEPFIKKGWIKGRE
jgi:hypothetical protein